MTECITGNVQIVKAVVENGRKAGHFEQRADARLCGVTRNN